MSVTKASIGCVGAILSLSVSLPAQAAGFNFTQISNSTSSPFSIFRNAAINNQGLVAFETFVNPQAPPIAVSAGSGGGITFPISDRNGPYNVTFYSSLNNTGTATFTGNLVDLPNIDPNSPPPPNPTVTLLRSGIYANTGGVVNTIADSTGGQFNFFGSSAINDAGTIAFFANFGAGESGIFTSLNGKVTPVAVTPGEFSSFVAGIDTVGGDGPFTIYTVPGINNSGKVAFSASLDTGKSGVFVSDGGTVKTIADTSSIFSRFSSAAINDRGTVAFLADLANGDRGLYTGTDQGLTKIADTRGAFSLFTSDPAINNKGQLAFLAGLDSGGKGIFTGADPIVDKVIAVGDTLDGLSVVDLIIIGKGLNDAGQVAFGAVLSDGSERIFRADVKAIPEPGSVAGLAVLGLTGGWLKRHRRRSVA